MEHVRRQSAGYSNSQKEEGLVFCGHVTKAGIKVLNFGLPCANSRLTTLAQAIIRRCGE
jgi:hypothetical protein